MSEQKLIKGPIRGYKATDKDMRCRGFQFELGKWYEHEGEIETCVAGFHFCEAPSGVWSYYSASDTRVFEIEAEDILDVPFEPGADFKRVCKRLRLIREVELGGDGNVGGYNVGSGNVGNGNTGNCNVGNGNTGDYNTGDYNTGDYNTGYRNTGDYNTGDYNTGYRNTGDRNVGNGNTGDYNTGDYNTGYRNTGDRNVGNGNTGDYNATNYSAGFFCQREPSVLCFDIDTGISRGEFWRRYWVVIADLGAALLRDEPISFERFAALPGITREKLATLHEAFKAARGKK